MILNRVKLGTLLSEIKRKNLNNIFGLESVRGVNNKKELIYSKADLTNRDLSKFSIVNPGEFFFNHRTSRNGDKFSITYNYEKTPIIITEDYDLFDIKRKDLILTEWLYMYFNRSELDRYVITNSWGSSTEFFNFSDLCNIEIELPPIEIQQKFVNIYNAMISNQKAYEKGLEDLKLTCDAYIENLRRNMDCESLVNFINRKNERNSNKSIDFVMGLSTKKEFREAQSRVNRDELRNYKIVNPGDFAFVPTTDTWKVLAFSYNTFGKDLVVSPIYEVFSTNKEKILPGYLAVWLSRTEFDRYARYHSWGSARENFSFEDMCNVNIPVPNISIQNAIVKIFNEYKKRKTINDNLKIKIKEICPILIKGSLEEARKS